MNVEITYQPNSKQNLFHASSADQVVYGGAKGGGKSHALVMEAVAYGFEHVGASIYLFRETYDDLEANIIKTFKDNIPKELYKYNGSKHIATLINGTVIKFRYIRNFSDAEGYQGRSMDWVGVDELTKHEKATIQVLLSCLRSPSGFPTRFRGTCNPGGIGHNWVKNDFISATTYGKNIIVDPVTDDIIQFIPASVYDNDILMKNDPNYVKRLENLPEMQKRAFLYGDWDIFEGQAFAEWRNDIANYKTRMFTHVIESFRIPDTWKIYRSYDFGYSRPFSVGWWAVDTQGRLYRIREFYGSNGEPNVGLKWTPNKQAKKIKEIEDKYYGDRRILGVADPSIWDESRGVSIAETFENYGIYFEKGDNKRIPGKMQIHYRLAFDDRGIPMMYIFNNCTDTIRTFPILQTAERDIEDIDTTKEDHIYDEVRYLCMLNPIAPRNNEIEIKPYNPLNADTVPVSGETIFLNI
jgi:hypothetical protein